ncbi:phospholipid carrier-dependent glycosyltransferase [Leucobacter allii]|uniref:Polyprenol-phosphate-mannose--protein mannosyltransferase n=1 Tax=Leucobacter allii TaxID=2932247 RepID=A0ABY4FIH6_9MICO|nr:phospholipid carrier-dependent glycosyltransferase [Leucobacter allii]UOQ56484.1 phospholipid carrier-dependent glycosyltransferase [Leucobacter allii]
MRSHLRWIAPALVLGIAAALRFWALGRPGTLVFDELFYVRDAISQLAHGFPTVWPDDDPSMAGERATAYTDAPANAVHPPLGKWIIGLGVLAFGPGNGWGWRSAGALAGVLAAAVTMRLAWRMSRSLVVACIAGLLLAIDGVHVVLSRVGLLDGPLTLLVVLGALCFWRDIEADGGDAGRGGARGRDGTQGRGGARGRGVAAAEGSAESSTEGERGTPIPLRWRRPWLLAAAAAFGAATAVKWSGLYPLAVFLILVTMRDLAIRLRGGERRAVRRAAAQAGLTAAIALPTAAVVYLSSWAGWIATSGGWGRGAGPNWFVSLVRSHAEMWSWHSTLSAPHPFQAHPVTWPLALRPTAMYELRWTEGCPWADCVAGISPLPNPLVTWGGAAALLVLGALVARRAWETRRGAPDPLVLVGAFVVLGYLSGWLPWMLTFSRSAVFQFYAVVLTPFSAIALALLLGMLCGVPIRTRAGRAAELGALRDPVTGRALPREPAAYEAGRRSVGVFLAVALVLAVLFFPVWSGMPVAGWFWDAHLWLPGWD